MEKNLILNINKNTIAIKNTIMNPIQNKDTLKNLTPKKQRVMAKTTTKIQSQFLFYSIQGYIADKDTVGQPKNL